MKYVLLILSILILDSCSVLGIGKQCYECTTTTNGTSQKTIKEVCGTSEMNEYVKTNSGKYGSVIIMTSCKKK